jgi:DNA repair exonuclease SbcCD nuclease subunit
MIRTIYFFFLAIIAVSSCRGQLLLRGENINVIAANDMGRRGLSEQGRIAQLMGEAADRNRIDFIAVVGDPIHDDGVSSVDDPEWGAKIESVYAAPSLHAIPWFVISGNHEYRGSVQAVLDYSLKSERWNAPARYFAKSLSIPGGGGRCLFIFIDTSPLINKYRSGQYSDAADQDPEAQLAWLDSTLAASDAQWEIVFGHHPVYADTQKDEEERADMRARVAPLLEKHGVDLYVCGHIHSFQHIRPEGSRVDYVVNSSASLSRSVKAIEGTRFCSPDPGFSVISVARDTVGFFMVNNTGRVIYDFTIRR